MKQDAPGGPDAIFGSRCGLAKLSFIFKREWWCNGLLVVRDWMRQSAIHDRVRWLHRSGMVAITVSGRTQLVERIEEVVGDISCWLLSNQEAEGLSRGKGRKDMPGYWDMNLTRRSLTSAITPISAILSGEAEVVGGAGGYVAS